MTQTTERPVQRPTGDDAGRGGPALMAAAAVASLFVLAHALVVSFQLSNDDESRYYSSVAGLLGTTAVWSLIVLAVTAVVAAVRKSARAARVVSLGVLAVLGVAETFALLKLTLLMPDF